MKIKEKDYSNSVTKSHGSNDLFDLLYEKHGERYTEYREKWKLASAGELLEYPLNIVFDLINSCNLSCPQCLRADSYKEQYGEFLRRKGVFSLEEIRNVMNESEKYGLPSVNIGGGGECMLHPEFLEIVKVILGYGVMELRVVSNGTKLTKEISQGLVGLQLPVLSISIDANSQETYQLTRGDADKYNIVLSNIDEFLEVRKQAKSVFPLLRVTFVAQPNNLHELGAFKEKWKSKADIVDIQGYCKWSADNTTSDFHCPEPWQRIMYYAEGTIAPCCGFTGLEYELARIEQGKSVYDIWHGKEMRKIRDMVTTKTYKPPCLKCLGSLQLYDK